MVYNIIMTVIYKMSIILCSIQKYLYFMSEKFVAIIVIGMDFPGFNRSNDRIE